MRQKEYGKEKDNYTEYTFFYLKLFCVTGLHVKNDGEGAISASKLLTAYT